MMKLFLLLTATCSLVSLAQNPKIYPIEQYPNGGTRSSAPVISNHSTSTSNGWTSSGWTTTPPKPYARSTYSSDYPSSYSRSYSSPSYYGSYSPSYYGGSSWSSYPSSSYGSYGSCGSFSSSPVIDEGWSEVRPGFGGRMGGFGGGRVMGRFR